MNGTIKRSTTFALTALAIVLAAVGCNQERGQVTSKGGGSGGDFGARTAAPSQAVSASTAELANTADAAVSAADTSLEAEQTPRGDETEVTPAAYLPPDVVATETELVAVPGSIVEILAEGSDDVVEMILSDGGRTNAAFRFDEGAGLWRASYRMPLRPASNRIGLSVTAKNAEKRWRRVWVFVKVPSEVAEADSAGSR